MQGSQRLVGEAGADLAGVAQVALVPRAHEEGAEVRAAAARRGEAADHEFFLGPHLHLAPRR
jgi:hypothetical protein